MNTKVELGFNSEARTAIAKFLEAKQLEAQAKALKTEAEATLRKALGDSTEATFGGITAFKLIARTNTYVDSKKLIADFPEAYEATKYETEYDFIKVAN
jgi:hypothetical protein